MMCIKERNASDSTCKKLLRDKGCFADLCNYAFFQGRQVIQPEELVSRENDLSESFGGRKKSDRPSRRRGIGLYHEYVGRQPFHRSRQSHRRFRPLQPAYHIGKIV